jgi:hypothetical protein
MSYEIRRIDVKQLPRLKELTRLVWGTTTPTSADLDSKFRTKSFGAENIGYAAYPVDTKSNPSGDCVPAAFYGVYPCVASFGKENVLCAQSGDTMTHPAHRGKGLFVDLARRTYVTAREEGIEFVFGFPSESSYPGFSKRLEWQFPHKMIRFSCIVPTLPIGLLRRRINRPCHKFGFVGRAMASKLFDLVTPHGAPWELSIEPSYPHILRDSRTWEYKAANTVFVQCGKIGIVLKYDGDISIGEIVGNPSVDEMKSIIKKLKFLAVMTGAVRIKSYFSPQSHLEKLLAQHGVCSESLPFGFINFSGKNDPSLLDLAYLDYDTF